MSRQVQFEKKSKKEGIKDLKTDINISLNKLEALGVKGIVFAGIERNKLHAVYADDISAVLDTLVQLKVMLIEDGGEHVEAIWNDKEMLEKAMISKPADKAQKTKLEKKSFLKRLFNF